MRMWSIPALALALGCATAGTGTQQKKLVPALQARGTFADVRPGDHWLFDPEAEGVADMPVVVTNHTRFLVDGKPVEPRPPVLADEPVIIAYRVLPDGTLELLQVELHPKPQ